MKPIALVLLATVTGGQAEGDNADLNNTLLGQWQVDGINAARCSNLDWSAQQLASNPGLSAKLQATADQCWGELRANMLNGQL